MLVIVLVRLVQVSDHSVFQSPAVSLDTFLYAQESMDYLLCYYYSVDSYVILGILFGLPLLLALLFRVSAVFLFTSVAAGALLAQYFADDTSLVVNAFLTHSNADQYVKLVLLILPVLLTVYFLRKTLSGAQLLFHLVPLVVTSAAFTALVMTALPGGVRYDLINNPVGKVAESSLNVLVAGSSILTLLLMWFTMRKSKSKRH